MHKVEFSLKSRENMISIRKFIAKDNLFYAEKVMESLFASCMQLSYFPKMGEEVSGEFHRMIVEPAFRYKITYIIKGKTVIIVSVSKYKE
jgi:plasmid stabilization system protein ParE